jgi:hypothetical protein
MTHDPNDRNNQQIEALIQLGKEHNLLPEMDDESAQLLNSQRPKIRVPGDQRELIDFCRECAIELAKDNRLFRRDRVPVAINREKARLDPMTPRAMRSFAQRYISFFKFSSVENQDGSKMTITVVKNIPAETAGALLESWELVERLPEIRRVNPTRLPVIRDDGRIELLAPGYFAERGIYTVDDGVEYDETMTREDAKQILNDLLKDFPFLNARSKSVAIAAILTMFCATMLPKRALRPGFIYTANAPGAGKTLLCKFAIIPVVGTCSTRTLPRKEETRKVLDSLAIDASIYIFFDNIRGKIASEDIEALITSVEWDGRLLGESARFRVDNVATVFLTGNQSSPSPDMADRCLFVELFIQEANNRDRIIPRIIDDSFLAEPQRRSQMLSAMWALVRAWDADGRPKPQTPMPRFEQWSDIVAGIVLASDFGDPLQQAEIPGGFDVELRDMHSLMKILAPEETLRRDWKFDQIIEQIKEHGLFEDADIWVGRQQREMFEKDGGITSAGKSFFGKLLVRYDDRLFRTEEGKCLRLRVEGKGNTRKYVVIAEG